MMQSTRQPNLRYGLKHRRNEAVILQTNISTCTAFTGLNTTFAKLPYGLFNGVIIRLKAKQKQLEILSLELNLKDVSEANVRVFTKVGTFEDGFFDNATSWQELTAPNTRAEPTPELESVIIPAAQFTPVMMEPKEDRLIYVAVSAWPPRVKSADFGDEFDKAYAGNDDLVSHVGYTVNGDGFSGTLVRNGRFHGIVHYKMTGRCENQRNTFSIELPYYVDQRDAATVIVSLAKIAISDAISKGMSRNVQLIRWQSFRGLDFQKYATETVVVENQGFCPYGWTECSKLMATLSFGYNGDLDPGLVEYEVLKYAADFDLSSSSSFEMGYYGKMPLRLDYFITLAGAQKDAELNHIQQNYFGRQTAKFLNKTTNERILSAYVIQGNTTLSGGDSLYDFLPSRNLDLTTYARIHTAIYGAYKAWPEPESVNSTLGVDSATTSDLLTRAFAQNEQLYVAYLADGLYRPGPISEGDNSDFFAEITGTSAQLDEDSIWAPTSAPTEAPTMDANAEKKVWRMSQSGAKAFGSILMILGLLPLLGLLVWELQRWRHDKEKLKKQARNARRKVDNLRHEQAKRRQQLDPNVGVAVNKKEQPLEQGTGPQAKKKAMPPVLGQTPQHNMMLPIKGKARSKTQLNNLTADGSQAKDIAPPPAAPAPSPVPILTPMPSPMPTPMPTPTPALTPTPTPTPGPLPPGKTSTQESVSARTFPPRTKSAPMARPHVVPAANMSVSSTTGKEKPAPTRVTPARTRSAAQSSKKPAPAQTTNTNIMDEPSKATPTRKIPARSNSAPAPRNVSPGTASTSSSPQSKKPTHTAKPAPTRLPDRTKSAPFTKSAGTVKTPPICKEKPAIVSVKKSGGSSASVPLALKPESSQEVSPNEPCQDAGQEIQPVSSKTVSVSPTDHRAGPEKSLVMD